MISRTLILLVSCAATLAWDVKDHQVLDVVEEIGFENNFYVFMGISPGASIQDIKKAYRKLSLKFHPDKNPAADAEAMFTRLSSINEILQDEDKRKCYDNLLLNGMPTWRSTVYYTRKVHKLGIQQLFVLLFGIVHVGWYLLAWVTYFEAKVNSSTAVRRKGNAKKQSTTSIKDAPTIDVPYPKLSDAPLLRVFRGLLALPEQRRQSRLAAEHLRQAIEREEAAREAKRQARLNQEPRPQFAYELAQGLTAVGSTVALKHSETEEEATASVVADSAEWTEEQLGLLHAAMLKYPAGVPQRWQVIASHLGRSVDSVTKKMKELKPGSAATKGSPAPLSTSEARVAKRAGGACGEVWSAEQHKALTRAMTMVPKSLEPAARWSKIADMVQGRTARECAAMWKQLSALEQTQAAGGGSTDLSAQAADGEAEAWTALQQKSFEDALKKYPPRDQANWDLIASAVAGKTKKQCIMRYKTITAELRKRRDASRPVPDCD